MGLCHNRILGLRNVILSICFVALRTRRPHVCLIYTAAPRPCAPRIWNKMPISQQAYQEPAS